MPTLFKIANELAWSFIQATNKKHAANHLIIEINSLRYTDSKKPIEYSVKAAIIEVIEFRLGRQSKDAILFYEAKFLILKQLAMNTGSNKIIEGHFQLSETNPEFFK